MRRNHAKYPLCLKKCLCNFKHSHSQLKMVAFKIKMTKQLFFLMESCKKMSVTRSTYYEVADCGHVIWIIQMFKRSFYNFLELMNKHMLYLHNIFQRQLLLRLSLHWLSPVYQSSFYLRPRLWFIWNSIETICGEVLSMILLTMGLYFCKIETSLEYSKFPQLRLISN